MSSTHHSNPFSCYRYILFLLLALPSAILTGCSKPANDPGTGLTSSGSTIVATVNTVPIDRDEMYAEMEQYVPSQLQDFPHNSLLGVSAGRFALQHLITNELTIQLAKQQNVPVTDQEVEDRYNDVKMVQDAQKTRDFEELLTDQGLTVQQYKDESVKPDVAQFNVIAKGITVSDQELQDNYNSHIADYTEPSRVHLERIVLDDEATAQQAYATASKTNSLDDVLSLNRAPALPGGVNDADIAQWIPLDHSPAELSQVLAAAAAAEPGTVLQPIEVQNKWWLIKLVERKDKDVLPFTQVKHIVYWNVATNKASASGNIQKVQQEMQQLTQQAVIYVGPPQYASLVKQLKNPTFGEQDAAPTAPPAN